MRNIAKKLAALMLVAVTLFSLAGCGGTTDALSRVKKAGKLVVGTSADYAPYEFHKMIDGKDTIIGFDIEIAKEIAKDLGVTLEIQDMGFDGLLQALNAGKVDFVISGMTPTDERKKAVDFSKVYYVAKQGVIIRTESKDAIKTIADLKGLRLRVQSDATKRLAELWGAQPVVIAAGDLGAVVEQGGIDAMITSSATGADIQAWKAMKVFLDIKAWIPKNMLCVSELAWRGFTEPERQAIGRAAESAEKEGWALAQQADELGKKILADNKVSVAAPSADLRHMLDLVGERFGREWVAKAGSSNMSVLMEYNKKRH